MPDTVSAFFCACCMRSFKFCAAMASTQADSTESGEKSICNWKLEVMYDFQGRQAVLPRRKLVEVDRELVFAVRKLVEP